MRQILAGGLDVNMPDPELADRSPPLVQAAVWGHDEVLSTLMAAGADLHATDALGLTALHAAADNGREKCGALLVTAGANVDAQDFNMETPLFHATQNGKANMAALLIQRGANVNMRSKEGWTPLHRAANNETMAALLLKHGADIHAQGPGGITPAEFATNKRSAGLLRQAELAAGGPRVEASAHEADQDTPVSADFLIKLTMKKKGTERSQLPAPPTARTVSDPSMPTPASPSLSSLRGIQSAALIPTRALVLDSSMNQYYVNPPVAAPLTTPTIVPAAVQPTANVNDTIASLLSGSVTPPSLPLSKLPTVESHSHHHRQSDAGGDEKVRQTVKVAESVHENEWEAIERRAQQEKTARVEINERVRQQTQQKAIAVETAWPRGQQAPLDMGVSQNPRETETDSDDDLLLDDEEDEVLSETDDLSGQQPPRPSLAVSTTVLPSDAGSSETDSRPHAAPVQVLGAHVRTTSNPFNPFAYAEGMEKAVPSSHSSNPFAMAASTAPAASTADSSNPFGNLFR